METLLLETKSWFYLYAYNQPKYNHACSSSNCPFDFLGQLIVFFSIQSFSCDQKQ